MAVSSTSASNTTSIDVAAIVEQLMKVENKPLDAIASKISQQKLDHRLPIERKAEA